MKKLILCLTLFLWTSPCSAATLRLDTNPCLDFVQTMERYVSEKNVAAFNILGNMLYGYYLGMTGKVGVSTDLTPFVKEFSNVCAAHPNDSMLRVLKRMSK